MEYKGKMFEKIIKDIKSRIDEFNADFHRTLLDEMVIKTLSCQFLDDDSDYFYSHEGLKNIFDIMKQRRIIDIHVQKNYNYLLIKDGLLVESDIFDKENCSNIVMAIKEVKNLLFGEGFFLFTISSEDINSDNSHNLFIFCVFNLKRDMPVNSEYFKDRMSQFLKYPLDFFNSPIVLKYYESIKFKIDVGNYAHTIYNSLPNSLTIIESTVKFIAAHHPNSDAHKKIEKAHKSLKITDLTMRILAGKEIREDDIKGKNIKGIIDFIMLNSILGDGVDCHLDFEAYNADWDFVRLGSEKDIFSILFNLWHNASKCKAYLNNENEIDTFYLKMEHDLDKNLRISFKNPCDDAGAKAEVNKLLSKNKVNQHQAKGMYIIKDNLNKLGWTFDSNSAVRDAEVEIILLIKA